MATAVPLQDIVIDPEVQARVRLDPERVLLFANIYRESPRGERRLPPVTLVKTPQGQLILADGFTRVAAAKRCGLNDIPADIRSGTKRDAFLLSIQQNAAHGSPLTLGGRRRAAERLLEDPEWRKQSDRELGRRCGLDNKTVSKLRRRTSRILGGEPRIVQRAGKTYQMSTPGSRQTMAEVGSSMKTSEEIPQMAGEGEKAPVRRQKLSRWPQPQPHNKAGPKGITETAAGEDQVRGHAAELSRLWSRAVKELALFADAFQAADASVRARFLGEAPGAKDWIAHSEWTRLTELVRRSRSTAAAGADV